MNEPDKTKKPYEELPAADLKITGEPQPLTIAGYPLVLPNEDINDKVVAIRGKDLKRWRDKLSKISKHFIPLDNVLLAISMLLLGAYFTVLLTGNTYHGVTNFLLNTVLPCLGVAFLISYFFVRRNTISSPKEIASELLNDIPNPDKIDVSGDKNESK